VQPMKAYGEAAGCYDPFTTLELTPWERC